jgi:hypothetical protein
MKNYSYFDYFLSAIMRRLLVLCNVLVLLNQMLEICFQGPQLRLFISQPGQSILHLLMGRRISCTRNWVQGGPYTVKVTYMGFKTTEITEINAPLGNNITVNVVLAEES